MKRIDLINRVLENMKDPDTKICVIGESKMKETIRIIAKKRSR